MWEETGAVTLLGVCLGAQPGGPSDGSSIQQLTHIQAWAPGPSELGTHAHVPATGAAVKVGTQDHTVTTEMLQERGAQSGDLTVAA